MKKLTKLCPECKQVEIPDDDRIKKCADCSFKERFPKRMKSTDIAEMEAYETD